MEFLLPITVSARRLPNASLSSPIRTTTHLPAYRCASRLTAIIRHLTRRPSTCVLPGRSFCAVRLTIPSFARAAKATCGWPPSSRTQTPSGARRPQAVRGDPGAQRPWSPRRTARQGRHLGSPTPPRRRPPRRSGPPSAEPRPDSGLSTPAPDPCHRPQSATPQLRLSLRFRPDPRLLAAEQAADSHPIRVDPGRRYSCHSPKTWMKALIPTKAKSRRV